jgi:spore maturation protein CgeB
MSLSPKMSLSPTPQRVAYLYLTIVTAQFRELTQIVPVCRLDTFRHLKESAARQHGAGSARLESAANLNMALNVLQLGPISGTCLDRAHAMRRLGHTVDHLDLRQMLPKTVWVDRITWRLGGEWFGPWIIRHLRTLLANRHYDLCYVEGGEWVTAAVIRLLRDHGSRLVNYNIDDPFGPRDGARFRAYRNSLCHYDLCVVVRSENIKEALDRGARDVLCVFRSADEINHSPRTLTVEDWEQWGSEVLFLGTCFPERGAFMRRLIELGVPITIRGDDWHKAREWPVIQPHWKGGAVWGDEYAKAIQCAKVCLGLVSKGNRDLHTTRSSEIPALGSLLCAERTADHLQMYEDGKEALLWSSPEECAALCNYALENDERRQAIARAGKARVLLNGHYNEHVLQTIISRAMRPH